MLPFTHVSAHFCASLTYIVGVEGCCIENSCLEKTSFRAQVDSGTSFTFLPGEVYDRVVEEV